MPEIQLPASLQGVEAVRSVRTPARLDYTFTPGDATSRFLKGITQKKIIGQQATADSRVYFAKASGRNKVVSEYPVLEEAIV